MFPILALNLLLVSSMADDVKRAKAELLQLMSCTEAGVRHDEIKGLERSPNKKAPARLSNAHIMALIQILKERPKLGDLPIEAAAGTALDFLLVYEDLGYLNKSLKKSFGAALLFVLKSGNPAMKDRTSAALKILGERHRCREALQKTQH